MLRICTLTVVLFASIQTAYAYQCGVQIDKLMNEAYNFSIYDPDPNTHIWPLSIEVTKNTKKFDEYAGTTTNPNVTALYLDEPKKIIIHEYRDFGLTETQSCSVMVHELCHHLQNVHNSKENMTREQREAECYVVQKNYVVNYADKDWAKRGNPIPLGPNGYQTVKEFKMIQRAKAASQSTDFDPSEYECEQLSLDHDNIVCQRAIE